MFTVVITEKGGAQKRLTFEEPEVTIGRVPGNDIVLPKGNVSKRHSRIVLKDSRFIVVDLKSTNGTYVNGRKITSPLVVKEGDKIYIGDFIMTLEGDPGLAAPSESMRQPSVLPAQRDEDADDKAGSASAPPPLPSRAPEPMTDDGIPAVLRSSGTSGPPAPRSVAPEPAPRPAPPMAVEAAAAAISAMAPMAPIKGSSIPAGSAQPSMPPVLAAFDSDPEPMLERTQAQAQAPEITNIAPFPNDPEPVARSEKPPLRGAPKTAPIPTIEHVDSRPPPRSVPPARPARSSSIPPATRDDLRSLMMRLGRDLDMEHADPAGLLDEKRWQKAERAIQSKLSELTHEGSLAEGADKALLASAALHEAVGLGPLDGLLAEEGVSHIVVERFDRLRVDRGEGLKLEETSFSSSQAFLTVVRRLLAQAGSLEGVQSSFDVSLSNGLHVVGVLPSAATEGPVLSLRRRPRKVVPLADLKRDAVLDAEQVKTLTDALSNRKNVLFVGPRADDLAQLIASALDSCPKDERIALFEHAPDIALGERPAICIKRGVATLSELSKRVRHFKPERCVIHDLLRSEIASAVSMLLGRSDGSMVSMERPSARDALAEISVAVKELGADGLDQAQRAVSLVVGLVHEGNRVRVAGVYTLSLEDGALKLVEP